MLLSTLAPNISSCYVIRMETNALANLRATKVPDIGLPTFIVGGCVRDAMLDVVSKDIDMAVEATSFDAMRTAIMDAGCKVFVETEEFLTIRAKGPDKDMPTLDFVMCRKDSDTSDGRRPDFVTPGTLTDDLLRRDFTVNAIAMDAKSGELIDPTGGLVDLDARILRFVGQPEDRIREDGLRVMRALRFTITKGLVMTGPTERAVRSDLAGEMLAKVSVERIRDELDKMFRVNTIESMGWLVDMPWVEVVFRDGLRLAPTLKK